MDQNSDSNFAAFELLKQSNALPTFISERSTSTDSFEKLASELFADRDNREYPIDTKENTFLSALHFFTKGDRSNLQLESMLKRAADFHSIGEDLKQALKFLIDFNNQNHKKYASIEAKDETPKYAYTSKCAGFFPIDTPENIIKSSTDLLEAKWKLPANIYVHAARNIVQAYDQLPQESKKYAKINSTVAKDGALWVIDGERMIDLLEDRFKKTGNQKYQWIKDYIQSDALNEQDCLMECQDLIYNVDRETNRLDKEYYNKSASERSIDTPQIKNPYTDVNSDLTMAEALDFCKRNIKIAHAYVPKEELLKLKDRIVAFTNNKTASENFFKLIEDETKDAICISERISEDPALTSEYLNNVLHVVAHS